MAEKIKRKFDIRSVVCFLLSVACIAGVVYYAMYAHSKREEEKKVPEDVYAIGEYVINVLDLYFDGIATKEETMEKLEDVVVYKGEPEPEQFSLSVSVTTARMRLLCNELAELKEVRNDIAELINYKE